MTLLLSILPLAAVVLLLASGRVSVLGAGLVGLALAIAAVAHALPPARGLPGYLIAEGLAGVWIAWPAVAMIVTGLAFHGLVKLVQPALFDAAARGPAVAVRHRRLFAACFLLGPFAESATGFGVGAIVAYAAITRLGVRGATAAVLALFSQTLVPWGALAVGTALGASLGHLPPAGLGARTAILCAPLLFGALALFWRVCARERLTLGWRQRVDDAVWITALAGGLYLSHRVLPVEIAGLTVTASLLVLRYLRDEVPGWTDLRAAARVASPYVLLTLCLVLTRVVPPLARALAGHLVLRPDPDLPGFAALFHPSAWLLVVVVVVAVAAGRAAALPRVFADAARVAWWPALVTVVFVVMARWMNGAGVVAVVAARWTELAGPHALLGTPVFAGVAGFLTGSGVAANGMMLPLQLDLASHAGASPLWAAAIQNTAGAAMTMVSPIRVAMVATVAGQAGGERAIYRRIAPLALLVLVVTLGAAVIASI